MKKIENIRYTARFLKNLSRLSDALIDEAQEHERIFKVDPFDPRLRTHKLHGKEKDTWAFSVNYKYRIKFVFLEENQVLFLDIGAHDIYT